MLRKIVNAKGGLHNRLTQTIRLLPFTLAETKEFYRDNNLSFSERDIIELYMIFGGVPHYLNHLDRGHSVAQHVDRICLNKDGALHDEFSRLFVSLFDADPKYVAVIEALAKKMKGLTRTELLQLARLPSGGGTTTILENLEEGGFIASTIPFGRTTRDRIYRVTDEFSLFHLKWLGKRRLKSWQQIRKSPSWYAWAGLAFESICLKHVNQIEQALGISGILTEASSWHHPKAQIDLLIDRADDVISVCEMKFTDAPFTITKSYAEKLRNKLAVFAEQTGTRKTLHLVFVTSQGVAPNRYATELVDQKLTMKVLF